MKIDFSVVRWYICVHSGMSATRRHRGVWGYTQRFWKFHVQASKFESTNTAAVCLWSPTSYLLWFAQLPVLNPFSTHHFHPLAVTRKFPLLGFSSLGKPLYSTFQLLGVSITRRSTVTKKKPMTMSQYVMVLITKLPSFVLVLVVLWYLFDLTRMMLFFNTATRFL